MRRVLPKAPAALLGLAGMAALAALELCACPELDSAAGMGALAELCAKAPALQSVSLRLPYGMSSGHCDCSCAQRMLQEMLANRGRGGVTLYMAWEP